MNITPECNTNEFRFHTRQAVDQIDAALFTGDEFLKLESRVMLRRFLQRWQRRLAELTGEDMRAHGLPAEEDNKCGLDDDTTFGELR